MPALIIWSHYAWPGQALALRARRGLLVLSKMSMLWSPSGTGEWFLNSCDKQGLQYQLPAFLCKPPEPPLAHLACIFFPPKSCKPLELVLGPLLVKSLVLVVLKLLGVTQKFKNNNIGPSHMQAHSLKLQAIIFPWVNSSHQALQKY